MAVKYSKQRDFGAKDRKTRKMSNKMWTLRKVYRIKRNAKNTAKRYRAKGWLARVIKSVDKGWAVYTHRPR